MGETKEKKKKSKSDDPEKKKKKKKSKSDEASVSSSVGGGEEKKKAKKEKKAKKDKKKKDKDKLGDTIHEHSTHEDADFSAPSVVSSEEDTSKKSKKKDKSHKKPPPPPEPELELFEAGIAMLPSPNSKKYGDITLDRAKKQCKKAYKLLNFDPWNEAMRYDDDDFCDYIIENPEPCKVKFEFEGFSGCIYPFSMCYALKASEDTVEAVYDSFKDAIRETDYWIGTPYHYAAAYEAPPEIVKFLLRKHPKGVEEVNYYGRTPLHMGALFGAPLESMELMCSKYPMATQIKDKDGYTPLHLACENGSGSAVVKLLVGVYPKCVFAVAQYQMMPLHMASSQNANVRVIRALLNAAEDNSICKAVDMLGHTPLHMALMGLAPLDALEVLVEACPETVWTKTNKGELPLEIGQRKRAPADVLQLLEDTMERILVGDAS